MYLCVVQPLGGLVSVHPVGNGRRLAVAIVLLLIAAVPAGVFGLLVVFSIVDSGTVFGRVGAFLLIPVLAVTPVAVFQLARAIGGGPGEVYELREHGFTHVRWGRRRGWTWDDVFAVEVKDSDQGSRFGWDFKCTVRVHNGSRLQFNGLTREARTLANTVRRRCPEALDTDVGSRWESVLPWVAPVLAIALGWVTWWAIDTIIANDAQSDSLSPDYAEGVEPLSGGELGGLSMMILFCGIGSLGSAVAAVWMILDRLR